MYNKSFSSLVKLSKNYRDNEIKIETEISLSLTFEGIKKYYYDIVLNENSTPQYIIDYFYMYIDILYNSQNYKKKIEVVKKTSVFIGKEKNCEKENYWKIICPQVIGELIRKKDDKYKNAIESGLKAEGYINGLRNEVNRLVNLEKENNKNNEKTIPTLFFDINNRIPNCLTKMLN